MQVVRRSTEPVRSELSLHELKHLWAGCGQLPVDVASQSNAARPALRR